jgi:hypothetical protein
VTLQVGPPTAEAGNSAVRNVEITVSVRAVGMTTSNDVAVQVLGLSTLHAWVDGTAVQACETNHTFNDKKTFTPLDDNAAVTLISWNRVGPDADGVVNVSWKLQVPDGRYAGLCAWAAFKYDLEHAVQAVNTSAAYLRLNTRT